MDKAQLDKLVAEAQSLPELIARLELFDPALAEALKGKALSQSKTVWATLATAGLGYLVTRYSLGWDAQTVGLVAGLVGFGTSTLVALVMRVFSSGRITSLLPSKES